MHQSKELFTKMFDCQETVPQPKLPLKFEKVTTTKNLGLVEVFLIHLEFGPSSIPIGVR